MSAKNNYLRHNWVLGVCLLVLSLPVLPLRAADAGKLVLIQTNSAGDSVHLIDTATNKVVAEIANEEVNHGVAVSPDGTRLYISNEAESTLDVVDTKTLAITKRIPLTGRPNNIAIHKDGTRVYVALIGDKGGVDVVDVIAQEKRKFIPLAGGEHNTFISPDSKFVVAGSTKSNSLTVISTETDSPVWTAYFEGGVRPVTFEANPDGSTKRMFVDLSYFHGFAIVDFEKRREVGRIEFPDKPIARKQSEAHGFVVSPDRKTLWTLSDVNSRLYGYSLPELKLVANVPTGHGPHWLTITPDGKTLYVANAGENTVSAIEVASRKEVARIKVGQIPKRNITAALPVSNWE